MADQPSVLRGFQDTGNPVLDSLVNLRPPLGPERSGGNVGDMLGKIHKILLELAKNEPGGLKQRKDCYARAEKHASKEQEGWLKQESEAG